MGPHPLANKAATSSPAGDAWSLRRLRMHIRSLLLESRIFDEAQAAELHRLRLHPQTCMGDVRFSVMSVA